MGNEAVADQVSSGAKNLENESQDLLDSIWSSDAETPKPPEDRQARVEDNVPKSVEDQFQPIDEVESIPEPEPATEADTTEKVDTDAGKDLDLDAILDSAEGFQDEPKKEEPAVDEVPMPDGMSDRQKEAFNKLAYEGRELKRQLKEAEEKVKLSEDAPSSDEVQSLKDTVYRLEEEVGRLDLSRSTSFKQKFDVPIQEKLMRVVNLITKSGQEPETARAIAKNALSLQDFHTRADFLMEHAPSVHGPLVAVFEDVDELKLSREQAIKEWKQTSAAMEQNEKRQALTLKSEAIDDASSDAFRFLKAQGNFLFNGETGNAAWDKEVGERLSAVKGILRTSDPKDLVRYVAEGVSSVRLMELFQQERKRRKALESQINATTKSKPSVGGVRPPSGPADTKTPGQSNDQVLDSIWSKRR